MIHNGIYISDNNSYSLLKRFDDDGPRGLISKKNSGNASMRYGSLLDDYIFLDKEDFNKTYKVTHYQLPPALITLAHEVRKSFKLEEIDNITKNDIAKNKIVSLIKKLNLYKNIKTQATFINKFNNSEFYNYCKELYDNKILIHISDLIEAKEGKSSLFTHQKTSEYFVNNFDNIYQLEIKFPYLGTKMKCFLDMVIIDHDKKIIKGIDLKTGSPRAEDFIINFFKFKYYLQAAIYYLALEYYNKKHFNGEYTVDNFKFLYLSNFDIKNPIVYVVSDKWKNCAINGFKTTSGYFYKGVKQLVKEVNWHRENKVFNLSKDAYLKKELYLDDKFIEEYDK